MADVSVLKPDIQAILSKSDLATISAKRVRAELRELYPEFDIRGNKEEIDKIISSEYAKLGAHLTNGSTREDHKKEHHKEEHKPKPKPKEKEEKPHQEPREESDFSSQDDSPAPKTSKRKVGRKTTETDEEIAARLHMELNGGRVTRGAASGRRRAPPKPVKKRKKSADEDEDETKKKRKISNTGFNKPWQLSPALAEVCGTDRLSRAQVTKRIWEYIKSHNLQAPEKKTDIITDEVLKKVIPVSRVNSFKMAKYIGDHLFPLSDLDLVNSDEEDLD